MMTYCFSCMWYSERSFKKRLSFSAKVVDHSLNLFQQKKKNQLFYAYKFSAAQKQRVKNAEQKFKNDENSRLIKRVENHQRSARRTNQIFYVLANRTKNHFICVTNIYCYVTGNTLAHRLRYIFLPLDMWVYDANGFISFKMLDSFVLILEPVSVKLVWIFNTVFYPKIITVSIPNKWQYCNRMVKPIFEIFFSNFFWSKTTSSITSKK